MKDQPTGAPAATHHSLESSNGFILVFSVLMLLGISSLAVAMLWNTHHARVSGGNYKHRLRAFYAADGIRALLAQEVLDGNAKRYLDSSKVGEIRGEVWDGVSGGTLDGLKAAMGRPSDRVVTSDYLGSNWKYQARYGVRWTGYLTPPATGSYVFYIRADDAGELYLSSDDKPENLSSEPIARVESWKFEWPKYGDGVSGSFTLKVGKRYYFEFHHVQDGDRGFGQVGWKGPAFLIERPIPGKRLAAAGTQKEKSDTATLGKARVKYSLAEAGPLVFSIAAEGIAGGIGDTSARAPVNQTLSLRGDDIAPPDSLWQKVIFYDFHSDRSNPDFNKGGCCFGGGVVTPNMVRAKGLRYTTEDAGWFGLDSIGKPMLGPTPRWNCGVEKWFTPWKPGWNKTYKYAGGSADCTESPHTDDLAFDNRVFKDSLLFKKREDLGVNAYQFKRVPSGMVTGFAPLDGKGFGSEGLVDGSGNPHNFSFCMELHTKFEHTSGMTFEFNGDDDVWLYINDSLVMDLGFVHGSTYGSVNLDDLPLKFGEIYPLDFFYCERQHWGSSIDLITNLPVLMSTAKPSSSWRRDYGNLE